MKKEVEKLEGSYSAVGKNFTRYTGPKNRESYSKGGLLAASKKGTENAHTQKRGDRGLEKQSARKWKKAR